MWEPKLGMHTLGDTQTLHFVRMHVCMFVCSQIAQVVERIHGSPVRASPLVRSARTVNDL